MLNVSNKLVIIMGAFIGTAGVKADNLFIYRTTNCRRAGRGILLFFTVIVVLVWTAFALALLDQACMHFLYLFSLHCNALSSYN